MKIIEIFFNKANSFEQSQNFVFSSKDKKILKKYRHRIFVIICQFVESNIYKIILIERFINGDTIKEISEKVGYSAAYIRIIIKKIFAELERPEVLKKIKMLEEEAER